MFRFSLVPLLVLLLSPPLRAADSPLLPPERGVILDIARNWVPAHWPSGLPYPQFFSQEYHDDGSATFTIADSNTRDNWIYQYDHPVDPRIFPICTLTYSATNIDTKNTLYAIWIDDTTGPANGHGMRPFMTNQLIADGQKHSLTTDLRKFKPKGVSAYMTVAVKSNDAGAAKLTLHELRFELPPGIPTTQPIPDSKPLTFYVTGPDSKPLKGARVTATPSFLNYRRTALTDDAGHATITPIAVEKTFATFEIESDGLYPASLLVPADFDKTVQADLDKPTHYSGLVTNDLGEPVLGATVTFRLTQPNNAAIRLPRVCPVTTDAHGRWTSFTLPDRPDLFELRVTTQDSRSAPFIHPTDSAALLDGSYTTILTTKSP